MTRKQLGIAVATVAFAVGSYVAGCNSRSTPPDTPDTLSIGDLAPPLEIAEWIKGQPVDRFEPDRVYVIDFWATWCAPCLMSIPHLSGLQQEYEDRVTFIGVTDESVAAVSSFLEQVQNPNFGETWDEVIKYRIGVDGDHTPAKTAYMDAASQASLPTAFIVGTDGRVQWIGHPLGLASPLSQILAGQWDLNAAKEQWEAKTYVAQLQRKLHASISDAQKSHDWSEVLAHVEQLQAAGADPQTMDLMKYGALIEARRFDDVNQLAQRLADEYWHDAKKLNEFAWDLATRVPREQQDFELAMRISKRANQLTQYASPSTLDTLARVYYEQGDLESAVQWQRKAADADTDGRQFIQQTLEKYLQELSKPAASARD